jgi:hypothetical protein
MRQLKFLGELGLPFGTPWLGFDEANVGLGHKEFMSLINRTVAKFVQMARFYGGVNSYWTLPLRKLFESNIMAVANVWIRITGKNDTYSWGKVYQIKPNEFKSNPPFRFKKRGTLKFRNPSNDPLWPDGKRVVDAYERNKMAYFLGHFKEDEVAAQEQKVLEKATVKPGLPELRDYVIAHINDKKEDGSYVFKNEKGELSYSKIMAGPKGSWLLSSGTATRLKSAVDAVLSQ